jgi:hypothetical protein
VPTCVPTQPRIIQPAFHELFIRRSTEIYRYRLRREAGVNIGRSQPPYFIILALPSHPSPHTTMNAGTMSSRAAYAVAPAAGRRATSRRGPTVSPSKPLQSSRRDQSHTYESPLTPGGHRFAPTSLLST